MQDLDQRLQGPKGTAFRAFKRLLPNLDEEIDFIVLDVQLYGPLLAQLKAQGRIYRSSLHPVLLSPAAALQVAAEAQSPAHRVT